MEPLSFRQNWTTAAHGLPFSSMEVLPTLVRRSVTLECCSSVLAPYEELCLLVAAL